MSRIVDEHRQYLVDTARLDAFAAALRALVRPGDVVLDLASGTGILGLLACQAGARRVYAVEMGPIVELARQIARDNGFEDRIVCVNELATRADLPEPVDLIVTDLIGHFGFEAGLIETLSDARRRFLKPGGRVVPSAVTLWLAPVEAHELQDQIDFWLHPVRGLSFVAAHAIAQSTGYPHRFEREALLAEPSRLTTMDMLVGGVVFAGDAAFDVQRAATLDGLAGWFTAELAPGIVMTNAPGVSCRINRRNVFFPLRERVPVDAGDRVTVSMRIRPASLLVQWHVEVRGGRDGRLRHTTRTSTFEGMLLSREALTRTRPAFQPSLSRAGHARRTVLELCDGARPLADIEREVFRRHADLFSDQDDAAAFVAEVVTASTT